jgi:TolB protein
VDGVGLRQVTFPKAAGPMVRWGGRSGDDHWSWPSWSPDGRWLSCFQGAGSDEVQGAAAVYAIDVDGVEERQLCTFDGQVPIYARWSPQGRNLAVLVQDEDELQLSVCGVERLGARRVVDEGVPLFFSWTPQGERLVVHVGSRRDSHGRLVVRDPLGSSEDLLFADTPGSFCTPVLLGDDVVYVVNESGGGSVVTVAGVDGRDPVPLIKLEGLLAVVPSPLGDRVAVGAAPRGESTPYKGIWVAGRDQEPYQVAKGDCAAFFWTPGGRRLVYAVVEVDRSAMSWWIVAADGGTPRRLGSFWPSRDQLFFVHFFEQYAGSHSLISPDGRLLVYSSHPAPTDEGDDRSALIYVIELDAAEPTPRPIAEGSFAVFAPPPLV